MGLINFLKRSTEQKVNYHFQTDKNRYWIKLNFDVDKTKFLTLFAKAKKITFKLGKEVKEGFEEMAGEEWEATDDQKKRTLPKLLKEIEFNRIIESVKQDLPNFQILSTNLDIMHFTKKNAEKYNVYVEIGGACIGEKTN